MYLYTSIIYDDFRIKKVNHVKYLFYLPKNLIFKFSATFKSLLLPKKSHTGHSVSGCILPFIAFIILNRLMGQYISLLNTSYFQFLTNVSKFIVSGECGCNTIFPDYSTVWENCKFLRIDNLLTFQSIQYSSVNTIQANTLHNKTQNSQKYDKRAIYEPQHTVNHTTSKNTIQVL